jgi:dGTP triphosphohydrolase
LFHTYYEAIDKGEKNLIPGRFYYAFDNLLDSKNKSNMARLAADIVCSFTDQQAMTLAHRLTGQTLGSISDIIVL